MPRCEQARPEPARRITVLGSPGSGKSTFCHALAAATGLPLYHLDDMYWRPGWQRPAPADWAAAVAALVARPAWIVDGNFLDTVRIRVQAADLVVLLDRNPLLCAASLVRRSVRLRRDARRGTPRRDYVPSRLGAGDPPVRSLSALARKALGFRRRELAAMRPVLAAAPGAVARCRTRREVARLLRALSRLTGQVPAPAADQVESGDAARPAPSGPVPAPAAGPADSAHAATPAPSGPAPTAGPAPCHCGTTIIQPSGQRVQEGALMRNRTTHSSADRASRSRDRKTATVRR